MIVTLVVQNDADQPQSFRLRSEETIIGRRRGCDIRIPSDEVSRRHCLLSIRAGAVTVEDLASVNGTLVNGRRISGRQLLYPGDRLEVGPVTFLVQYARAEAAGAKSPLVELEEVPVLEEDTEAADSGGFKLVSDSDEREADLAAEAIAEMDKEGAMNLPENDELRDLLTQMEDAKPKKERKKK